VQTLCLDVKEVVMTRVVERKPREEMEEGREDGRMNSFKGIVALHVDIRLINRQANF